MVYGHPRGRQATKSTKAPRIVRGVAQAGDDGMTRRNRTQVLTLAMVAAIGLQGCQTVAGEKVAEFTAERVNSVCKLSPPSRLALRQNILPYLEPGVWYTVTCPDKAVASR